MITNEIKSRWMAFSSMREGGRDWPGAHFLRCSDVRGAPLSSSPMRSDSADAQVLFAHVGLLLDVKAVQYGFAAVEGEDEVAGATVVSKALVFFAWARRGCGVAVPVAEEVEALGAQLFDSGELLFGVEGEVFFAVVGVRQEEDFLDEFLASSMRPPMRPQSSNGAVSLA